MKKIAFASLILGVGAIVACQAPASKAEQKAAKPAKKMSKEEKFRAALAKQDKYQKACSNEKQLVPEGIPAEQFKKDMLATIKYPKGGVVGDWKKGEKLFGDPKKGGKGRGNCYACHCGDPSIIACGNIGPSLRGYGKRGIDPKTTYQRIYNPWSIQPCSAMFRFGVHGILSPEQIAHVTAFLHDPNSPINK